LNLYFTDIFDVDPGVLDAYGAFDISLINDLPLFVDPFLLFNSKKAEYQELHQSIIRYLRFLRDKAAAGDIDNGLLNAWFVFREVKQNWLGYSRVGNSGSGLGRDFAQALFRNLHRVLADFGRETLTKSSHLEKLCLIKRGVGRDNISDFTTCLIKEFLLEYTQSFVRQHLKEPQVRRVAVPRSSFNYSTESWVTETYSLPFAYDDYVILSPKEILTKSDTWINRTDLVRDYSDIAQSIDDEQLRSQLNNYFVQLLPDDPTPKEIDQAVIKLITEHPEIIDYYIRFKENNGDVATSVSERQVREVQRIFHDNVVRLRQQLTNETRFYQTGTGTYDEVFARVMFLKDVIENKGGHRIFYADGRPLRRETDLHILFRLTWFGMFADVSREVNDGRGPVDFKVSVGALDKSLVEFKLASNSKLRRNLEKQTEIYQGASDAQRALKVIVYFTEAEFNGTQRILSQLHLLDSSSSDIVLIDARGDNKPSGSTA
jgi:hypothetical protein